MRFGTDFGIEWAYTIDAQECQLSKKKKSRVVDPPASAGTIV